MGIVEGGRARVEAFDHLHALDHDLPGLAAVGGFMDAAAGHAEIEMLGIAGIDDDRMHLGPVGRAVLHRAHPFPVLRIVVDAGEGFPGDAAIGRAEQALGRRPGIPDIGLALMGRGQPECVIDAAAGGAVRRLGEGRRALGFFPAAAEIGGAENRGAEMAGLRRRQQGAAVAGIEDHVIDDMAEEMRPVGAPGLACGVAVIKPGALARCDHHQHPSRGGGTGAGLCRFLSRLDFAGGFTGVACHSSLLRRDCFRYRAVGGAPVAQPEILPGRSNLSVSAALFRS